MKNKNIKIYSEIKYDMIGGFTLKLYQDKKHTQLITKKHFDYKTLNEALQKYKYFHEFLNNAVYTMAKEKGIIC